MKITDQAKEYIQQAMQENNVSTLRFFGIQGCCGVNLGVSLQEAEENDVVRRSEWIKYCHSTRDERAIERCNS